MVCHFTPEELAQRWRMSERTLETWRSEGLGPCYLKMGNRILYRQQDIDAYESSRCYQQIGSPPIQKKSENTTREI